MKNILRLILITPILATSQVDDFVSELKLGEIYINEISLDFWGPPVYGNEHYEHYQYCKSKGLSLYSYDSIYSSTPALCKVKDNPRLAFFTAHNFDLMICEEWDPLKEDWVNVSYTPFDDKYDYHIGNGFAFSTTDTFLDFNKDGYLDHKVEYTRLNYDAYGSLLNDIIRTMFSEYEEKIENGEISKDVDFKEYSDKEFRLNDNFGLWGYGYLTKYSDDGYLYFVR